jgi:hypothetical protein
MTQALVLALPNFSTSIVVECDAFGSSIEAILLQDNRPSLFFLARPSKDVNWVSPLMKKK